MFVTRRMQRNVVAISPSASLQEARRLMRERNVRQLPVTAEDNKLVGVLSDRDIREAMLPVRLLPGSSEKEMEKMLASTFERRGEAARRIRAGSGPAVRPGGAKSKGGSSNTGDL